MNILFMIDELITKGGTEQHLFDLSVELTRAGHRVSVLCLLEGKYGDSFRSNPDIAYHCLHVKRIYNFGGMAAIFGIARYIRLNCIDIVQTFHTGADLIGPIASLLSFRHPVVLSSRRDLGYTKSPRHIVAQRLVNQLVDRILANSKAVSQSVLVLEKYPVQNIEIIYNGIHSVKFPLPDQTTLEELREKFSLSVQDVVIGSVGNIRPVKGYDVMVEVAACICRQNANVVFIHAGDGEGRSELESRCKDAGIARQFRFLGHQHNIPEILSLMDVYLQPSRTEGFSNAVLEAMSTGLPVVATRVGGNPEIIDEGVNGFLVDSEDVAGMTTRLLALVKEPGVRTRMGNAGREKILEHFDISHMIKKYERYYYECMQGVGSQ